MNFETMKQTLMGLVMSVLLAFPAIGMADLITFDGLVIDRLDLAGVQTEGAFQYQATVGDGWEVQGTFGNPASALATFFSDTAAKAGDTVEIKLTGGGLFSFVSVDFRTILAANNDQASITGFLAGNATETLVLGTATTTFQTMASGFSGPIDLLRIVVTLGDPTTAGALLLDNFNLAQVPEPSSFALVLLGALALFSLPRRRPALIRARRWNA